MEETYIKGKGQWRYRVVLKNSADSTSLQISGWAEAGPGSAVEHAHPPSVYLSQQLLRPEPLLPELLIYPSPVIRVQWWLGGSLIVDSAPTVGAAVVSLIEYPL
jgi:hypothetical protein